MMGCKVRNLREGHELGGATGLNRWLRASAEVAEDLDVPMLSVCDLLYQAGAGPEVFLDSGHLDPRGLRIVADALFALFAERGMLPDPVAVPNPQAARR